MGRRSVIVRVDQKIYDAVYFAVPKESEDPADGTVSGWLRLLVETLVAQPETNVRRRALLGLERDHPMYDMPSRSRCTLAFRVEAEHWAALTALARVPGTMRGKPYQPPQPRPGMSRVDYFRRMVYIGSLFRSRWYGPYRKDEDERSAPSIRVYS